MKPNISMNSIAEIEAEIERLQVELEMKMNEHVPADRVRPGEDYFFLYDCGFIQSAPETGGIGSSSSAKRYRIGNYFKTKEEAVKARDTLIEQAAKRRAGAELND